MISRARRRIALSCALAVLVLAALALGRSSRAPAERRALVVRTATYVNRVDDRGTTREPRGGVVLRTNRGFEVRLLRARLIQQSASLVDCLGAGGDVWSAAKAALFSVEREAHAGHGQGLDPSAIARPAVVDLLADAGSTFGETSFATQRYCRVHLVFRGVAAASTEPRSAQPPGSIEGSHATLEASGEWRREADERAAPGTHWSDFDWRTTAADALLLDVPALVDGSVEGEHAEVTVERFLARALDDIDFAVAVAGEGAAGRQGRDRANAARFLRNVNHGARVRVRTL